MAKETLSLLLLLLLLSSFTVFAEKLDPLPPAPHPVAAPSPHHHHHHHHPHSPTPAPLHPPTHSPVHSPVHPPTHSPVHSPVHPPTHSPVHPPTHHHHHLPPAHAPVDPPTHAPVKPPTLPHHPPTPSPVHPPVVPVHPPLHPPLHPFPRSFVAVQGVVYSKPCKFAGVDTLLGATPLLGAIVKLECNNTKHPSVQTGKTDKNGFFFLEAPKTVTTFGAHKCKVFLVSAPGGLKPSNLHGGVTGSLLRPEKSFVSEKLPFLLYTVGPLAFDPKCPR